MKLHVSMRFTLLFSVLIIGLGSVARAQPSAEMAQAFLNLRNDGVIMNISAHPDDEDGATLAYYRMKYGVKTYSILFTRGEGGQNEIGPELYEELGVLRTAETEAAGKILGTEVHFLNFQDFGFSKTAIETFKKWGGPSEPLRRLVLAIRKYKPDVIFTNHSTAEGHGHHQVVAITAIAAFDAAADSSYFPEQLKLSGVALWQPRKLYFRNFGRTDQTADVVNQIDEVNPARGTTYLDIASDALQQHKTQGMDRADLRRFTRGLSLYRLTRSNSIYERDTTSFLGGIQLWNDPSLASLKSGRGMLSKLHPAISKDSLLDIASKVMALSMRRIMLSPLGNRMLSHWQEELEHIVELSCGIDANWSFSDTVVVPTQKVKSTLRFASSECAISDFTFSPSLPQGWAVNESATPNALGKNIEKGCEVFIGDNATLTLPATTALYNPLESEQDVAINARCMVNGRPLAFTIRPKFDVAPYQILCVLPSVCRIAPSQTSEGKRFEFRLKNFAPRKIAGRVRVQLPPGWTADQASFAIADEDSLTGGSIFVKPPRDVKAGDYKLRFTSGFAWSDATVKVFDFRVDKNLSIGIVRSYDNTLESAAKELGIPYTMLSEKDLKGDLSSFSTIIVDIRAYLVRDDLKNNNQRLLDYARNGGHVVVMYQKDQDWKSSYAPFPFDVTRKRVTVEEAPMTILKPDHPLFNLPNKISDQDWEGWIQERGVYFPGNVAKEYESLLSSNDPDEPELTTGYLLANVGRGSYIYTSYVWYRQLKEFNPGAYRCFINMIAYPMHRARP
jgi:LmbE family N-acetylglucosaminyl deacetylase